MSFERIAVSEFSTLKWAFEEDVAGFGALGFGAIGVCRQKLADYGVEKGAELLIERAMQVSSLQWAGGFTGADGRSFVEAVEDAQSAVYEAALLGAECLIVHGGGRNGHTSGHAMRLIRNALRELTPLAQDYGIKLAIEPTHPVTGRDCSFVHQIDRALELIAEFGSHNVGLVCDTYEIGHDDACMHTLESAIDQICLIQIADACYEQTEEPDRRIPGEGCLPLREMISLLTAHGYDGFYELELLGPELSHLAYETILMRARKAMSLIGAALPSSQTQI